MRAVSLVADARGAIVWWGERGIGRSVLLDAIVEHLTVPRSDGVAILRWSGGESGRVGADARVSSLLVEALGAPSLSSEGIAEWDYVLAGRTLVVVADDIDDLPREAGDRLLALAASDLGVVVLATATRCPDLPRLPHGIDVRELPAVETAGAMEVLAEAGCPPVAPHVASRLVTALRGNPACLVQTARLLRPEHLAGTSMLPDPLPLVPAVGQALSAAVEELSARDREILLVACVMVSDRVEVLARASGVAVERLTDSDVASHLTLVAGRFRFRDPRLRAFIHGEATLAERTAAHARLVSAYVDDPDAALGAWHRALSALEGDEGVVQPLLRLARRHLRWGDCEWAHAVAREAVGHATGAARSAACEVTGIAATLAGHVHDAELWLPHASPGSDIAARARTLVATTLVQTLTSGRIPDDMLEGVWRAVESGQGIDARVRSDAARGLSIAACLHIERGATADAWRMAQRASEISPEDGGAARLARAWLSSYAAESGAMAVLPAESAHADDEALTAVARAVTLMHRDESDAAARVLASTAAHLAPVRSGASWFAGPARVVSPIVEAHLRVVQALVEMRAGDLDRAATTLRQAAERLPLGHVLAGLAVVLSRRLDIARDGRVGMVSRALESTSLCRALAPVHLGGLVDRAMVVAFAGRHEHAAAMLDIVSEREVRERSVGLAMPGLEATEEWAMAGMLPEARHALERLRLRTRALAPGVGALLLARGELAVAPHDEVAGRLDAVHAAARRVGSPYELARTAVSVARAHARQGAASLARAHYMSAIDLFDQAGAGAWVPMVRAEAERVSVAAPAAAMDRAAGPVIEPVPTVPVETAVPRESRPPGAWSAGLTEREREVASLVAQGLPNRDVAERLFMSVRTVEVHLGRVYRKVGVRSRVELVMHAHGGAAID
ncbi:helix-turn-helix transcriptional regulator [Demequina sp. NBRC 110057]|uniref:helix-turn-helix domain-containing protein n=1 Tax=Demequina sp. NBRC 110057 TaxID=1570346 RepID=UPI0009FF8B2F|nr:helix-turn-helix transcriptional regulator [Demequina sp. NBRC 110057]